jgi:hypothetical protein
MVVIMVVRPIAELSEETCSGPACASQWPWRLTPHDREPEMHLLERRCLTRLMANSPQP